MTCLVRGDWKGAACPRGQDGFAEILGDCDVLADTFGAHTWYVVTGWADDRPGRSIIAVLLALDRDPGLDDSDFALLLGRFCHGLGLRALYIATHA